MRRIGVLMGSEQSDPDSQIRLAAFRQVLRQLGWTEGRNIRIDERWGAANPEILRTYVALQNDGPGLATTRRVSRDVA